MFDAEPGDKGIPVAGRQIAAQHTKRGRLSRPVHPQQSETLPFRHPHAHLVHRQMVPQSTGTVYLKQIFVVNNNFEGKEWAINDGITALRKSGIEWKIDG